MLRDLLEEVGIRVEFVTGHTEGDSRQESYAHMSQEGGDLDVLILSIKTSEWSARRVNWDD